MLDRTAFLDELLGALRHLARSRGTLAVLLIEVADTDEVVRELGYSQTDGLFQQLGSRIEDVIAPDDVVGRFSTEQFAVLVNDIDSFGRVMQSARKMFDAVTTPAHVDGHTVRARVHIGVALPQLPGETVDRLLRRAQQATSVAARTDEWIEVDLGSVADRDLSTTAVELHEPPAEP